MRPQSIVMFERLFLASMVVSLLSFFLAYDQMMAEFAEGPALSQLGSGGEAVIAILAVSVAIYLLLWFGIARKASKVAKWVLIVLVAIGLVMALPAAMTGPRDLSLLFSLAVNALEIAAIVYLFRNDAKAWFAGQWQGDASTFD